MRRGFVNSLFWKFIFTFIASILSLAAVLWIGYYFAELLLSFNPSSSSLMTMLLRWFINHIGSLPLMTVAGVILFLLFFFLYSRSIIKYIEEITRGLNEIAHGNLALNIPVKSMDELGVMAEHINVMASRLKTSIDEERDAVKAKNDLITGVSHDLRTPLTSIIGFLEYIETDRYRDEPEVRYYVNIAYEKSLKLKKLIDDLFDYTRLTSGELPPVLEKLDVASFLRQMMEEYVPLFEQAGMDCRIETPAETLYIEADAGELVRAFENLVTNAIRYAKAGKYLDVILSRSEEQVEVGFRNYGEPIPSPDLPYLFERFYRVDKSRTNAAGGSGLGLAITKSIIERQHGTIRVTSTSKSTTFVAAFPQAGY
ncbi:HAMP domain-containing protein [Paenibacillus lycopersici]|uniref:histidine kinase n=1 Tax=Paenibacillus lycopersici TaxID=2704462 RepID=A0A6C0G0R6_9BACL|nr:HAMP domain-containing sensor histidine kinase [Paenibacillus lycopersici]QHT62996.1 HAMP domain-containing protein [Paenibacillus lycopersici]